MTDGDLISRQAVLDIFGDIHPLDYNARAYVAQIKELPSEKVDGDLISRQAVKDLIRGLTKWSVKSQDRKYENVGLLYDDVMFGIDRLPSAEKIAECDNNHDCEHCDWTECPLEAEKETDGESK